MSFRRDVCVWIRSRNELILWKADIEVWPISISVRMVMVNGHPSTPLTQVYMQTEKVSLILTGVLKRFCVCRLVEGIVSLSQLSHQGAVLNGHRIKATSLRNRVNTHLHEFGHTTLFSSKHTLFFPLWILELPGVQQRCRVQPNKHNIPFKKNTFAYDDTVDIQCIIIVLLK